MRKPRARKGSQRQTVEAVQLFGRDDQRAWFEARVVALVMQGHTVRKAETIAAQEIVMGRTPE